jgi:predicted nucleotidyltransferase
LEASLVYKVSSRTARATQRNCLKKQNKTKQNNNNKTKQKKKNPKKPKKQKVVFYTSRAILECLLYFKSVVSLDPGVILEGNNPGMRLSPLVGNNCLHDTP